MILKIFSPKNLEKKMAILTVKAVKVAKRILPFG
jgi:hypothetical protein